MEFRFQHVCLIFYALVALALVAEAQSGAIKSDPGRLVNWQIHSWDDLREWDAMMAKGAQWLKIDMHYMTSSYCLSQGLHNADGCFVLLHDSPLETVKYNTSDDVVSYIASHPQYFNNPTKTVYIALCFKDTPIDLCGASGDGFLRLLTAFKQSVDILASKGANINFVLDGSLDMTLSCTKNAFRPWPSTWQGPPLPAFFSNDSSLGYDRLQVFDLPDDSPIIATAAALNWGKFGDMNWPLLLWEPADESSIVEFAEIYLTWAKTRSGSLPEFKFAINIDPIQFQVYASSATRMNWRQLLSSSVNTNTRPTVTVLPPSPASFLYFPINGIIFEQSQASTTYAIFGAEDIQGEPYFFNTNQLLAPFLDLTSAASSSLVISGKPSWAVLTSDWNSSWSVYTMDPVYNTLRVTYQNKNALPFYSVSSWALSPPTHSVDFHSMLAVLSYADPASSCAGWQLKFVNFTANPTPSPSGSPFSACVTGFPTLASASQASASIVALQTAPNVVQGMLTVASNGEISAAFFVLTIFTPSTSSIDIWPPVYLGVGNNTSLSALWSDAGPLVHEVHADGYCWNTEKRNKQSSPLVCDQAPTSTPGVLNYNYAPLSHWRSHLLSEYPSPLTSCSASILHGTFDQGAHPSAALVSSGSQIGVINVNQGWKASDQDISQCGAPMSRTPSGGTMLSSWLPVQWNL